MGVVPCPRFECQILTFPGAPDCEAVPGRLWPGRRPLTTALGPAALGVRFSPGRSRSGQPLAPRCPQPSGAAASGSLHCGVRPPRRAGGLRGSAHSEHLIPLPPRPRALGAPGTPECPGGGAGTPAWPLAVARDSRGETSPQSPSTLSKHTKLPAPSRSREPPSFTELAEPADCSQFPGYPLPQE